MKFPSEIFGCEQNERQSSEIPMGTFQLVLTHSALVEWVAHCTKVIGSDVSCAQYTLCKGKDGSIKSDEFSENTPHISEWSPSLGIMCMHFILSGPRTSLHIFDHIHYRQSCDIIFRK